MFEQVIETVKSLPPDVLQALLALVKLLANSKDQETRRAALDAALAAGEAEVLRREWKT